MVTRDIIGIVGIILLSFGAVGVYIDNPEFMFIALLGTGFIGLSALASTNRRTVVLYVLVFACWFVPLQHLTKPFKEFGLQDCNIFAIQYFFPTALAAVTLVVSAYNALSKPKSFVTNRSPSL
jgi:uncharacterized membrane protein